MIGQLEVINQVDRLIENKKFSKFSIIVGEEGYGKHTLCKYIANKLGVNYLLFDNKISDMRSFIETVTTQAEPYLYILQGGDSMSIAAKNSILKVAEEVPAHAHIILLINNRNATLDTLLSRGIIFELNNYKKAELLEYCNSKSYLNADQLIRIANCPGEIDKASKIDAIKLIDYAGKVIDNMKLASLPNALKVSSMLNGSEDNGYDLMLFLNAVYSVIIERMESGSRESLKTHRDICQLISDYTKLLSTKSINIKYVVDNFIINLWRITG